MDGVIIDSNPYHKIAWTNFFRNNDITISEDFFQEQISGTTGDEAIASLLDRRVSDVELDTFNREIDAEFRKIISESGELKTVPGFRKFIGDVSKANHKIALATSAPPENVDLVLNSLGIMKYFDLKIDKTQIVEGKPNPEIYLKTLHGLKMSKDNCIVFEDSLAGISSATNAGLRVIGVATSHPNHELIKAGAIVSIKDFTEISIEKLIKVLS